MKKSTKSAILKTTLIVAILIVIALAIYLPLELSGTLDKIKSAEQLKDVILQGGAYSYIIFFVIQFLQVTLLPIPAAVTTVAGTLVFGPWITIALSFVSVMLASIFSFFLGRKVGKKLVIWVAGEQNFDKWSTILGKGKYVFFLMMLFPVFPDDILCLIVGSATNMSYTFFIVTNLITRPIGIITTCFLGSGRLIPFSGWGIPVWIVLVVVAAILFYISIKYQAKIEAFVVKLSGKVDKNSNDAQVKTPIVSITALNDNRCEDGFECEHGLSLYITTCKHKLLLDAGQTDVFIKNANRLNINLNQVDTIVLSHGDYDHGNGLKYLTSTNQTLVCHPDFIKYRKSKRTGKLNGLNQTKKQLQQKFNLITSASVYNITDDIIFLGQIPRVNNFEIGNNPAVDKKGQDYAFLDDSGIVIKTPKGIVVVVGCAHSGICNIVEYAKRITNTEQVYAVVGGFHLKNIDTRTQKTIDYLKASNVQHIMLAHCVDDIVCAEFEQQLPTTTIVIKAGKTYAL